MIIVTGAAGFIGSNLAKGLNDRGLTDIVAVDDLTDGDKHKNLNALRLRDYLDKDELLTEVGALGSIDAVFHQGACSSTTEKDGRFMMETNYRYSKRLATFCLERHVPFFYASSASVYGNGEHGFTEEPRCEWPLNVYAYSKLAFDNWVRARLDDAASPIVGLRYFNVFGPQENHKGDMMSVARKLYDQHARGDDLRLFEGSDEFLRDFVYVDDCVDVNLHFFERGGKGVFNVGTGQARSFGDVGRTAVSLLGPREIEHVPMPPHLNGKYQAFTQADLTALRRAGYERPFLSLEDGMSRYFAILNESGGYRRRSEEPNP